MPATRAGPVGIEGVPRSVGRRSAAVWLAAGAWGAGAGCSKPQPLRIGFLGGLSGRVADLGIGGRNGAQLAVDEVNATGGIDGRPLELVVRDDEQSADVALRRLTELVDAGVSLVIGPMTSSVAVALAPLASVRGVVLISPTAATHELSGKADGFFRVISDAPGGAAQHAAYLFSLGHRSIAVAADHQNKAFTESWTKAALGRFTELGGRVALDLAFQSRPGLNYSDIAQQLAQAGADVVLFVASAADSAVLMQQLRRRDPRALFATSSWAGTEQLIALGGRAVEGTIVPQYYDRASAAPAYRRFVDLFAKRFGDAPGYPAVNGWDAVMLGVEALRRTAQGKPLLDAVRTLRSHAGLQRKLILDEYGDSNAPLYLTRIQNGQFVLIDE